jgi:hypothetical protein
MGPCPFFIPALIQGDPGTRVTKPSRVGIPAATLQA